MVDVLAIFAISIVEVHPMADPIAVFTMITCAAICGRLLTYRRQPGTRHRPGVSWLAWLLIVCTGGEAIHIAVTGIEARASIWQLGVLLGLAMLTFKAHGNVAAIIRLDP